MVSAGEAADKMRVAFGRHVRRLREAHDWRQLDLTSEAGFHKDVIGQVERAQREFAVSQLPALAKALGVPVRGLIPRTDEVGTDSRITVDVHDLDAGPFVAGDAAHPISRDRVVLLEQQGRVVAIFAPRREPIASAVENIAGIDILDPPASESDSD